MGIKNIIFDLGAVILDIDYNGPANVLKKHGIHNFEQTYSKAKQSALFDNFEKGLIDAHTFRNELRKYIDKPFSDKDIDEIWNAVILDFPKERIDLLLALKKHYKTFLLSNTNIIHYDYYTNLLHNKGVTWRDLLHKSYFSFNMQERKPDLSIFKKVINENRLNPDETVFIDDLKENVDAAKKCGLYSIWLKDELNLNSVFYKKDKRFYIYMVNIS